MKKIIGILLSAVFALVPLKAMALDERFSFGDNLELSGELNSNDFSFGNKVNDSRNVKGLGFLFGNSIESSGSFEYGFHAGNTLKIKSTYERDLFAAGGTVEITSDAVIGRDAYLAGDKITINTNIPGTVFVAASEIVLGDITIGGDLRVAAGKITVTSNNTIHLET